MRSCLGFARFNFALRTCSPALIVKAIAAFEKAMPDIIEVSGLAVFRNHSVNLRAFRLIWWSWPTLGICPRLAHLCHLSKTKSRPMASAAHFGFDSLLPILAASPLL